MTIEFSAEDHSYLVDGEPYPNVTSILSAEGLADFSFANAGHRNRGTAVHDICDLIDEPWPEGLPEQVRTIEAVLEPSRWYPAGTDPELVGYGYGYCQFLLDFRPVWKLIETPVASKIYRYAGRLDRHGLIRGKPSTADIKSGEPADAADVQVSLYGLALEETHGLTSEDKFALWLRKNGTYRKVPGDGTALRVGIAAVTLFHWRKERRLFA